jgi:hypothetical protein
MKAAEKIATAATTMKSISSNVMCFCPEAAQIG